MGRIRTIFKPYKDRKKCKSGDIIFYVGDVFHSQFEYSCPSARTIQINRFVSLVKHLKNKTYHWDIIPFIAEISPDREVFLLYRKGLDIDKICSAIGLDYLEVERIIQNKTKNASHERIPKTHNN